MTYLQVIVFIPLLAAAFAICIGCALIGIDKAVRKNDQSYYVVASTFICIALMCGIGLGSLI